MKSLNVSYIYFIHESINKFYIIISLFSIDKKSDGGFLRLDLLFLPENKLRYLILRVLVCFRELILL